MYTPTETDGSPHPKEFWSRSLLAVAVVQNTLHLGMFREDANVLRPPHVSLVRGSWRPVLLHRVTVWPALPPRPGKGQRSWLLETSGKPRSGGFSGTRAAETGKGNLEVSVDTFLETVVINSLHVAVCLLLMK